MRLSATNVFSIVARRSFSLPTSRLPQLIRSVRPVASAPSVGRTAALQFWSKCVVLVIHPQSQRVYPVPTLPRRILSEP